MRERAPRVMPRRIAALSGGLVNGLAIGAVVIVPILSAFVTVNAS